MVKAFTEAGGSVRTPSLNGGGGYGSFIDNDNIGTSVSYVCPNYSLTDTITTYVDDDNVPFDYALYEETGKSASRTVSVIKPTLSEITYGGSKHTISDVTEPEYTSSPAKNEPVAYSADVSSISASVKLSVSSPLTEGSFVDLLGETDVGLILEDWYGEGTLSSEYDTISCSNVPTLNTVSKIWYDTSWMYKVPNGSDTYISFATQYDNVIFVTLSDPVLTPNVLLLNYACSWADGASTANEACEMLLSNGFAAHYSWEADCNLLSSDFVRLATAIGIAASQHQWASIGPTAVDNMTYQRTKEFVAVGVANLSVIQEWSWHQWSEAGGKQRDPSAAASLAGNWGAYEDDLFTHYREVVVVSPLSAPWTASHTGQTEGCEAADHRFYNAAPDLSDWHGPDR